MRHGWYCRSQLCLLLEITNFQLRLVLLQDALVVILSDTHTLEARLVVGSRQSYLPELLACVLASDSLQDLSSGILDTYIHRRKVVNALTFAPPGCSSTNPVYTESTNSTD